MIFMEADRENGQATDEIEWVLSQAEHHTRIRSAVAHVPLERPPEALETIRRYAADPFVVGVRRNIQDEAPGFTEDSHIREDIQPIARPASPSTHALANTSCPSWRSWPSPARTPRSSSTTSASRSRPPGASGRRHGDGLRNNRTSSASSPAWPPTWHAPDTPSAFALPLLREALDVCGPDRCLFGCDWPVMLLATDYRAWLDLVREALGLSSWTANDAVLRGNAERIYRLVPSRFQAADLARKEAR
nr:amidohydrolase family protein [Streptomyces sp. MUSC 14]